MPAAVPSRRQLPRLATLHDAGTISTAFLDTAGHGLDRLPPDARDTLDEILSGPARICDPQQIRQLVAQLRVMIDPDGASARADHHDRLSRVSLDPVGSDGAYALTGTLYGLHAEQLHHLLATPTPDARRHGDTRPADQRRATALFTLFTLADLAEHAGTHPDHRDAPHGADAHVILLVTPDTWNSQPGASAATTAAGNTVDPGQVATIRCTHTASGATPDLLIGTTDTPHPPPA